MVAPLHWETSYRIIPSRYPEVAIFDAVADPADLETILILEAATNPRILDEAGELPLVRPEDRISGPGTTPIMASFTHAKPSRFSDGRFGVYYASQDEETAIAETAYHRARFLRDAQFPSERLDMRVYTATITGEYEDLRKKRRTDPLYDPDAYAQSQAFAVKLQRANVLDGIVFRSVRRPAGECVAAFRPRLISHCKVLKHLEYRFEDYALVAVIELTAR